MSNRFLIASISALQRHGLDCSYVKVTTGAYNVETGSVTNTEVTHNVRMYKKTVKVNQYNFPSLINKDVGVFYLANYNLTFTPSPKDKIIYNGNTYIVESYEDGMAHSEIVLFKVLAVKN